LPGVVSRHDDLTVAHQINANLPAGTDMWHVTGQFLHIHRYYLHAYETLLRTECNYTGHLFYWDEAVDAGAFAKSPVVADFGGPGDANGDVHNGPYANITYHVGPGPTEDNKVHHLNRHVNESVSIGASKKYVNQLLANTTFADFRTNMLFGIHVAGHLGVGGNDMGNILSAPNDPLFFLHHTYVDWVWTRWQSVKPSRVNDLANVGYTTQAEPATGYVNTTAATVLNLYGIIPNATVGDLADIQGGYLCYQYDKLY